MKKVILLIVTIAAFVIFYTTREKSPAEQIGIPTAGENGVFHPDPSNATFIFDDGPITLSAGRNERSISPGSTFMEETVILDKFTYGDINADGKQDTILFLARYGAGSGTFIYVAAYVSGPITYKGSKTVFLGDRIAPQSISVSKGIVVVEYLDREPDEALAAEPTVLISKQFIYQDGKFQVR